MGQSGGTGAHRRHFRDAVFAAVGRDELAEAVDAIARLGRSPDDCARERVLSRYSGVRKYLPALLDTIAFMANDAGQPVLEALAALNATWGRSLSAEQAPLAFASGPWRSLVEPEAGQIDRAAYAMCAVEGLRDGLRRRDIYVAPSRRYGDARASLLADPAWEASCADTRRSLALPADPGELVEQLATGLDLAYDRTLEGLDAEHPVFELAAGRLDLDALDALPQPPSLIALRDRVDALLPAGRPARPRARDRGQDRIHRRVHQRRAARRPARGPDHEPVRRARRPSLQRRLHAAHR